MVALTMIVSVLLIGLVLIALYIGSHRLNGAEVLATFAVFVAGASLVIVPNLATDVARRLNVGRGTDLVVYVAMVLGAFVCANFYFRFKRDEQALVAVVRALALTVPRYPKDS